VLLLGLRRLLAALQQQLVTLLASLLPQFGHLPLGLLADRGVVDQLLPLPLAGGDNLLGLAAGLADELLALPQEIKGLVELAGQGLAHGIHHLDGVLLVDQATTAEGDPRAFQHDLLELVELIEHGDAGLSHGCPGTNRTD